MDYAMISVDDHIDLPFLPKDLWTERLAKPLAECAPRVVEDDSGNLVWVCDGQTLSFWAGSTREGAPRPFRGALERGGVAEPGVLRPTIPELRLADMDRDGVETSVMYGPVTAIEIESPDLRLATYRAYNDWLIDFCRNDPKRLLGVAMLPVEDPAGAAEEVQRLAKVGGIKQVSVHIAKATTPIYDQAWEPFWSAVEETGIIPAFHLFISNEILKNLGKHPAAMFDITKDFVKQFLDPFVGLFAWGVLERHPKVKLVLAESGLGWLPWVVQEMDRRYAALQEKKAFWDERGGIGLSMKPSEVFKRQVYVTFQDDKVGLDLLDHFGPNHVLWASDYPHPDSTWPFSREAIERQMGDLPEDVRRQILRGNAQTLYGL
jgi:predicted TIM-barrel fold metal-dependent hydrolase